jgi:hypothetical protein
MEREVMQEQVLEVMLKIQTVMQQEVHTLLTKILISSKILVTFNREFHLETLETEHIVIVSMIRMRVQLKIKMKMKICL